MPRLFFHIGLPKCATTTVQTFLAARRDDLLAEGLRYDFPPGLERPHQGNGVLMAQSVLDKRPQETAAQLAFHLSQGPGDVLVSSEVFSAIVQTRAMSDLAQAARDAGYAPHVIVFLRRQDYWIESDFKQQIKGGRGWDGPIAALVEKRIGQQVLNYALTLAYWTKHVGKDHVHVFALQSGQGPAFPVEALLSVTGHAAARLGGDAPPAAENVSPPAGLIEPARLLKQRLLARGLSADTLREALERFFHHAPRLIDVPPRRFLQTRAARAALLERFRGSNADVARDYLGGRGFATDLPDDPDSEAPLAPEAAAVLDQWTTRSRQAGLDDTGAPR